MDELYTAFGESGIEVVDSEQTYREHKLLNRRVALKILPEVFTQDPDRLARLEEALASDVAQRTEARSF